MALCSHCLAVQTHRRRWVVVESQADVEPKLVVPVASQAPRAPRSPPGSMLRGLVLGVAESLLHPGQAVRICGVQVLPVGSGIHYQQATSEKTRPKKASPGVSGHVSGEKEPNSVSLWPIAPRDVERASTGINVLHLRMKQSLNPMKAVGNYEGTLKEL